MGSYRTMRPWRIGWTQMWYLEVVEEINRREIIHLGCTCWIATKNCGEAVAMFLGKAPRYVRRMSIGLKLGWKNFGFPQRLGPAMFRVRWFWANFITNQPPVREMEFAQDFVREVSPKMLDRNLRFRIFLRRLFAQMFFSLGVTFYFFGRNHNNHRVFSTSPFGLLKW